MRGVCRPFFSPALQGAIIRQSSAPARARARSFDPVTRKTDVGVDARARSPEDHSLSGAHAASNRQPLVSQRRGKKVYTAF